MKYFIEQNSNLMYIDINIHSRRIIVNKGAGNVLYAHNDYNRVIEDILKYFKTKTIVRIKEDLKINLENIGIKVIYKTELPQNEGEQFNLF